MVKIGNNIIIINMIPLYTEEEYKKAKGKDLLPLKCKQCDETFYRTKNNIHQAQNTKQQAKYNFCGLRCFHNHRHITHTANVICSQCGAAFEKKCSQAQKHSNHFCSKSCKDQYCYPIVTCLQCGKTFHKYLNSIKKYPRHFCSTSCSATYCGTHKPRDKRRSNPENWPELTCLQCGIKFRRETRRIKHGQHHYCSRSCASKHNKIYLKFTNPGTQRSKLEHWIEKKLLLLYPSIKFVFNDKKTINAELDIYIPEISLAFELNGPFHYEPIHGQKRLDKTQNNDKRKMLACAEKRIGLCVIDTSHQGRFTPKSSQPFLDIITKIINEAIINQKQTQTAPVK